MTIRVFPIAGLAELTNSFGADRGGRPHQGNDIMAAEGLPLLAVDSGELRSGVDPLGGLILNLNAIDGTRYYYAHLSRFSNDSTSPPSPRHVTAGDLVGFVGRTGNAATSPPHLHFEAHPGNGPATDPFPALNAAPRLSSPNQGSDAAGSTSSGRSKLAIALALAATAIGVWALLRPREAKRVVLKTRKALAL